MEVFYEIKLPHDHIPIVLYLEVEPEPPWHEITILLFEDVFQVIE
jgi:hypothetical protein